MSNDLDPSDSTVYRRTHKGQIVAVGRASAMDPQFMLWLRMVNGLTPTHALRTLSGMPLHDTQAIIHRLLDLGLIERLSSLR